jgi:hypothetical protein
MAPVQRDLHRQLHDQAHSLHERIAKLARPLDPERLVRRPEAGGWSVGEVLEHLSTADEVYARPLAQLTYGARADAAAPLREWKPTMLGRFMARALDNPRKLRAPRAFRPGTTPRNGVVEDFLTRDSQFLRMMDDAASLDWRALRMRPPTIPVPLTINLGDVFNVRVIHVRRHLAQMERVVAQQ